jgi:hypothetical protein
VDVLISDLPEEVTAGIDAERLRRLRTALALGEVEAALDLIPWERMSPAMLPIWQDAEAHRLLETTLAGQRTGAALLPSPPPPLDPERLRALAMQHLQSVGASRVQNIADTTRSGLRRLLVDTYGQQQSVAAAAKDIRAILDAETFRGLVGLNPRQAAALAKRVNAWTADPKLSVKRVQQLALRERNRMLKARSKLIAQTEVYDAGNEGLVQIWREQAAAGGRPVKLGRFIDRVGPRKGETVTSTRPPLHPGCYCMLRLVRSEDGEYYVPEWVARVVGACPRCEAMDGALAG